MNYLQDKKVEHDRYDSRAARLFNRHIPTSTSDMPLVLQAPYRYFEEIIKQIPLGVNSKILEIGAGTGAWTRILMQNGAFVTASDISENCLRVLSSQLSSLGALETKVADMEALPFDNEEFNLVACAGSLSYGDNQLVMQEIYRVLKPGGHFICVDSLNHNPIYRFNRWLHYRKGERSLSTLMRMPTLNLIHNYKNAFGSCEVRFFGAISWLMPVLCLLIGQDKAARLSDRFDSMFLIKKSAFKFVMIAKKSEGEVGK